MANKISKVIAKKSRSTYNNSNLGYIKPIFKFEDSNLAYKKVNMPSEFPNDGEIFVLGGYNYIDNSVKSEELFEIEINENETNYDPGRSGSCQYTTTSSTFRKLDPYEFIRIFSNQFDLENKTAKGLPSMQDDRPFFLEAENYIYGPFNIDVITLSSANIDFFETNNYENLVEELISEYQDHIFKYSKGQIEHLLIEDYIVNLVELLKLTPEKRIYFGSKEKIIEWAKRMLGPSINQEEKAALNKIKNIPLPDLKSSSDLDKLERFKNYIDDTDTWLNVEVPKYFMSYLSSQAGQNLLKKYLDDNQEHFFEQYRSEDRSRIEEDIKVKSQELESIEQKILASELASQLNEDKIFENLTETEKVKLKSIITNLDERTLLLEYFDSNKELKEIKDQITGLEYEKKVWERQIDEQKVQLQDLTEAIKKVKDDFLKGSDFAKKVIDAKIYSDLINNIDPSYSDDSTKINVEYKPLQISELELTTKQFIEELQLRLNKQNRFISFNDIVNYLVLINQNFLTIIAGLPGTGKTSLVEKIAKVIGSEDNDRYLKISVARGWTSSKDLIGYFNPLTKKYQPAKTGLYKFLKSASLDNERNVVVPSIVLLDEANLSPMEHYWSDFLTLADFDYKREIPTSDNETIEFGSGVRFLATINYDHTTEILSDRLLSRAPVVRLNISDYKLEDGVETQTEFLNIFSMENLHFYLNKNSKDNFKGDIKNKFDSIIKILQDEENYAGQPIIIGMRKYKAVEKYCNVAGSIMDGSNNKFIALDYAILQYVLPMLNGRGDGFYKRLSDLKEQLQGLPNSLKHLNRMIQFGIDNFKNFKFFC